MDTNGLIAAHKSTWTGATRHAFLEGIQAGDLPVAALNTWLVQDRHYVDRLLRFQALVLAGAPPDDQLVLAQGLVALADELHWFDGIAQMRGLDLAMPLQPACRAYTGYLLELGAGCVPVAARPGGDADAYTVCITAVWTVERAYLDAWMGSRPGAGPFREFVEHWTTADFGEYVERLAAAADRALATAAPDLQRAAEQTFLRVAHHECDFWQMAFAGRA